jgi:hypothetical protein
MVDEKRERIQATYVQGRLRRGLLGTESGKGRGRRGEESKGNGEFHFVSIGWYVKIR